MNFDTVDKFDACEVHSHGAVLFLPARLRALLSQFPAVSHGLLSVIDQTIVSATSFATVVIIGRATSPEYFGLYYLIASIVAIVVGIEEQIVAAPYTIYSKRFRGGELLSFAGSAWVHHFALTALSIAALVVAVGALSLGGGEQILPGLWALMGAGPFVLLREWIRRFSYANLQIVSAVALDSIVAVSQLSGLLLLWHLHALSLFNIYVVMGVACAIASVGWYAIDRPVARFERCRYVSDWKQNWSFGRWALRSFVVGNTTPYLMTWMLGLAVGTAAAGTLGACATLINISNLLVISIDRVLTPRAAQAFVNGGYSELRRVLILSASVLLPILAVFCLFVFAIGSRVAVFVYGNQYEGYGATLTALAIVVFMNGVGIIMGNGLWAIDQPRSNFVADFAILMVTIVSALLLIAPLGVLGAALAMLVGTTTGSVVRTIVFRRTTAPLRLPIEVFQT